MHCIWKQIYFKSQYFASHFPLAYPIKTHAAAEVVHCLILVFTTFGFTDQILSDCGSEFMSELMQLFYAVQDVALPPAKQRMSGTVPSDLEIHAERCWRDVPWRLGSAAALGSVRLL